MNELCLFAGGGGGLLATKWLLGWRTVCYVENEPYCIDILKARIRDGLLDDAPIWDDARTFDGRPWRGCVDIVTAGFPCQPFSTAGKRQGEQDKRNLWPETIRIIREVGPRFCLLENVPGLLSHEYYGTILGQLSESRFNAPWKVISAAEVGAPHKRDRVWIVADAESIRCDSKQSGTCCIIARGEEHVQEQIIGNIGWYSEPRRSCNSPTDVPDADSGQMGRPTESREECSY